MSAAFPEFGDSAAKDKIADLKRLMDSSLVDTEFVNGAKAAELAAVLLRAYRRSLGSDIWTKGLLGRVAGEGRSTHLTLAAMFDLISNLEYCHGRVVNSKWIYCHRNGEGPVAYYSFLKQCPRCCLDKGLEARLSGAQHKPSSHHIGEITTVVTALILQLLATVSGERPLRIASITKQSHDVDAIGYNEDTLVLFEIKSSPMASFPLVADLSEPMLREVRGEVEEYSQHSLVDLQLANLSLSLYLPHTDWRIPLGTLSQAHWPYDAAIAFFGQDDNFLRYLEGWLDLYYAYSVPKTERNAKEQALSYLVNGWGDLIDSNKTKPGLGRTDDIKKGTYQMLKFGAYYRDDSSRLKVRSALVANLDPLFLRDGYLNKLTDVRWARQEHFSLQEDGEHWTIRNSNLRYLYDALLTLNQPLINDEIVAELFDFSGFDRALHSGRLDNLLDEWSTTVATVEG